MENREIIKILARQSGQRAYWNTFSRYIVLLDNYLRQQPLSRVEPRNHFGNEPRAHYLNLLAAGFEITIDNASPLFENRLDTTRGRYFWQDDEFFYRRFFWRLAHFRSQQLPFNEATLKAMVAEGSLAFNAKYNYHPVE